MSYVDVRARRGGRAARARLTCLAMTFVLGTASSAGAAGPASADGRPKVAVMPLTAVRVPRDVVTVLDELLLNELYARGQYSIISLSDMNALLGFEKVKSLVDCSDIACAADIGGALGVRYLLAGSVAKLGTQIIVTLKLLDTKEQRVEARAEHAVENDEARFAGAIRAAVGKLLASQPAAAAPAPGPSTATGRLEVTTTPPGAACEIDGKPMGKTPCTLAAVPAGNYTLRLALAHHAVHAEILAVEAGKTTQRAVALVPDPVAVRVSSTPAGATVTVDGTVAGKTPLETPLGPGSHEVAVALEGYGSKAKTLKLAVGDDPVDVKMTLAPLPGRVVVTSTPNGAAARLLGRFDSCTTDCALTVSAGTYQLRVTRTGYEDVRQAVSVAPGKDTAVALALTPVAPEVPRELRVSRTRIATVLTVVAGVGLGVFAWQGLRARSADQDLASMRVGSAAALAKQDEGNTAAHVADVALVTSLLSAAGASYLWVKVAF